MTFANRRVGSLHRCRWMVGLVAVMSVACDKAPEPVDEGAPLPVTVFELQEGRPSSWNRLTASVASWKTENVGFEVPGRVQYVVEPEMDVTGEQYGQSEKPDLKRALLARLDPTRYELAVASAKASVETEERRHDATNVEIGKVIPAQLRAAEAERKLAEDEFKRAERLIATKAISQSEFDKYNALFAAKTAAKDQLTATLEQRKADLAAIAATINQLEQTLAEANRDLKDTRLLSAYPAQVAQVHAIPGAYVERGTPVCTVQMMDPMRVDIEVSAQTARQMHHGNRFPVFIGQPDGSELELRGFVYMIDPTADSETRTFTVTLFVRNGRTTTNVPPEIKGVGFARTERTWRFVRGLGDNSGRYYTEQSAIRQDAEGPFVYKILNRKTTTLGRTDPVLLVQKVRIRQGDARVTMLGIVTFLEVELLKPEEFDLDTDLIAGELTMPEGGGAAWDGKTVLEDRPRWRLRPGDLVAVELGVETPPGFYVPLNSVRIDANRKFIFAVKSDSKAATVESIEVDTFESVGKLIRVEAVGERKLVSGGKVVFGQAHYLQDGEPVTVVEETEVRP